MDFLILRTKWVNDLSGLFDFELKCSHLSVKGNFSSLPSHSFVCFCLSLNLNFVSIDTMWYFILCFIKEIWDAKNFPGSQLVYNKWWWVLKPDQLGTTGLEYPDIPFCCQSVLYLWNWTELNWTERVQLWYKGVKTLMFFILLFPPFLGDRFQSSK